MDLATEIRARGATFPLAGRYAPEFRPVVDAFVENFRVEDENIVPITDRLMEEIDYSGL